MRGGEGEWRRGEGRRGKGRESGGEGRGGEGRGRGEVGGVGQINGEECDVAG